MTGAELIAAGQAALAQSHRLILLGGVLGVLSIVAGLISRRIGAPVLLAFLALGMLAGEDGPLGIPYDDFGSAYLIGSVALAVILLEGGLKTPVSMLRLALWPAALLATIGVGLTAGIAGGSGLADRRRAGRGRSAGRCGCGTHGRRRRRGAAAARRRGTAGAAPCAARSRVRAQRPDVGLPDIPADAPDRRAGIGRRRRRGADVLRGDGRWCRTRVGRRLVARTVAEALADRSLARPGAGADRWARRIRAGPAPRHQRLPRDLFGCGGHRRHAAPGARRMSSTSSKGRRGSPRSCCF